MSDFEIIQKDETYEVEVRIVRRTREFAVNKDYRASVKEISQPTTVEVEVEAIHFSHEDKVVAITRAINHLHIIGDFK